MTDETEAIGSPDDEAEVDEIVGELERAGLVEVYDSPECGFGCEPPGDRIYCQILGASERGLPPRTLTEGRSYCFMGTSLNELGVAYAIGCAVAEVGGDPIEIPLSRLEDTIFITRRCSHIRPNVSAVPATKSKYGKECRSLFHALPGYLLVGADADGIELRCLAHYMHRYDGGAFSLAVVEGNQKDQTDPHSLNCIALGFDPLGRYVVSGKHTTGATSPRCSSTPTCTAPGCGSSP